MHYRDISPLHAHIVCVSLGFLLNCKEVNMDIFFLYVQIVYVFLGLLEVSVYLFDYKKKRLV